MYEKPAPADGFECCRRYSSHSVYFRRSRMRELWKATKMRRSRLESGCPTSASSRNACRLPQLEGSALIPIGMGETCVRRWQGREVAHAMQKPADASGFTTSTVSP
jgi:hypothetical protein